MKITTKPFVAAFLAAAFSCGAAGWAQTSPDKAKQPADAAPSTSPPTPGDDAFFLSPLPPPEPMFDFMDEAMVTDAPPMPTAPPVPFTMPFPPPFMAAMPFNFNLPVPPPADADFDDDVLISLAPSPEGDFLSFTGPDGPGPIAEGPQVTVQAGPQGAEVTVEDHGSAKVAQAGPGGAGSDGPGGPGAPGCPGGPRGFRGHCPMGFGGGPFGVLTGDLALKDDQLEKLHAIKNEMLDATGFQQANLESYRRQLKDVVSSATVDRAKATELQAKINNTKATISNARLTALLNSRDVLTEAQRKALHEAFLKRGAFGGGAMRMRFHRHHF